MGKYARLRERLVERGIVKPDELHRVEPAPLEPVLRVHDAGYVRAIVDGSADERVMKRIGFRWSPELVSRSLASVQGTLSAARAALGDGLSGALAGGTHHAFADAGSGFCVFNDLAIAA